MQYTTVKTANLSRNFFRRRPCFFASPAFCTAFCYPATKNQRIVKVPRKNPLRLRVIPFAAERARPAGGFFRRRGILRGNEPLSGSGRFVFCRLFSLSFKNHREGLANGIDIVKKMFYLMSTTQHLAQHIYQTVCQKKFVFILCETSFFS